MKNQRKRVKGKKVTSVKPYPLQEEILTVPPDDGEGIEFVCGPGMSFHINHLGKGKSSTIIDTGESYKKQYSR